MNRIPNSPSTSSTSSSGNPLAPGALDDTAHSEPGNPVPALQLPPTLNFPASQSNILEAMRAALASFQGRFELPATGQGWMLPRIPQPEVGESSRPSASTHGIDPSLKSWVDGARTPDMRESRARAARHFQEVLRGNDELKLTGLALGALPDIFDRPEVMRGLRFVRINSCRLDTLPASLLRLPQVQFLNVESSHLSLLPEFGEMPELLSLDLRNNRLTELPESIGRLSSLGSLNLNGNLLESLPESISRLTLRELVVSSNRLHQLPDFLGDLRELTSLDVSGNHLNDLPGSLSRPPLEELRIGVMEELQQVPPVVFSMAGLEVLHMQGTALTTLPPDIIRLSSLEDLNVSECGITSVPEELFRLPAGCQVNLSDNPLSQTIVANLLNIGEGGPQVHFSVDDDEERHATQPLEANVAHWLKDLSPEDSKKWAQLGHIEDAREFNDWLERMTKTADYQNPQTRPDLEQRMQSLLRDLTSMLESMLKDPKESLLPTYLAIAQEATSTCRDRIAVGLNNLELQQITDSASRGKYSISQLMTLGREMFIRNQIDHIAKEKVKGLRGVDEVEVHLAYQVGLRKTLDLTLGNQDMLYRACSQVGDKDLGHATQHIQEQLQAPGLLRDFLADWEPMRQLVRRQHMAEWQEVKVKFDEEEARAYSEDGNTDWKTLEGLGARREQAFHDLCARVVDGMMSTDLPSSSRDPEETSTSKRKATSPEPSPDKRPRQD